MVFLCLTIEIVAVSVHAASPTQEALLRGPFYWREKKNIFQGMQQKRRIPVSVTHDHDWFFKGVGIVRAPAAFTFAEVQKYDKLKTLPDHFQNVKWDQKTQILSLDVHFLSRIKSMKIHIEADAKTAVPEAENLLFRVEEGWFQGLEGVLMVRAIDATSEVGIVAESKIALKWVPDFVFSLAAEAVMHHVAESLRTVIESDYNK